MLYFSSFLCVPSVYRAANATVILVINNISLKFPDYQLVCSLMLSRIIFYHADDILLSSLSLE